MLSVYLLLLTFKVTATVMCAVYCWRIARLNMTPTFTYMLFFTAFSIRVGTQIYAAFFYKDIVAVWVGTSVFRIIVSQIAETVIVGCFLIGYARKYYIIASLPTTQDKVRLQ